MSRRPAIVRPQILSCGVGRRASALRIGSDSNLRVAGPAARLAYHLLDTSGRRPGPRHVLRARCLGRLPVKRSVQCDRSVNERQMCECLREVSQLLATETDFLGVEAEVIGVGEHLLERKSSVFEAPGLRESLYVPERAQRERALRATESVRRGLGVVAIDEAVGDEFLLHGAQCRG